MMITTKMVDESRSIGYPKWSFYVLSHCIVLVPNDELVTQLLHVTQGLHMLSLAKQVTTSTPSYIASCNNDASSGR